MISFRKFIAVNHPDPDSVFGIDSYDFDQIMILAENFKNEALREAAEKKELVDFLAWYLQSEAGYNVVSEASCKMIVNKYKTNGE